MPGGESAEKLIPELTASALKHNAAGLVSLVVFSDVEAAEAKERLIARGGKLVTVTDQLPPGPNGTGCAPLA